MTTATLHRARLCIAFVFAAIVVISLAACGGDDDPEERPTTAPRTDPSEPIAIAADEPIVIGVSAPLTGSEELGGHEALSAVLTSVDRWKEENGDTIAGHSIEVIAEDDGCTNPEASALAANRLLSTAGVVGVIGPYCSAGAEGAIPVYSAGGVVAISGSATQTDLSSISGDPTYFFRTAYRNDLQGTLIGSFAAIALQAERVFVLDDGESYGQNLAASAAAIMEESGVDVTHESAPPGTEDFGDLASQAAESNPDLVAFTGFNPQAALFYRQLRDAGYTGLFGASDAAASVETFLVPLGDEAENVLFSGCAIDMPPDFLSDFRAIHGTDPRASSFPAQILDATTVLLNAVAAVAEEQGDGSLSIDPAALRDTVASSDLEGVASGNLGFDENGDRVPHAGDDPEALAREAQELANLDIYLDFGLVPCQVQDGEFVNLLGPGAGTVRGLP